MFERFTQDARRVIVQAQQEAATLGHPRIMPEHLLLGLIDPRAIVSADALRDLGFSPDELRRELTEFVGPGQAHFGSGDHVPFAEETVAVLNEAAHIADELAQEAVHSGYLLIALVRSDDPSRNGQARSRPLFGRRRAAQTPVLALIERHATPAQVCWQAFETARTWSTRRCTSPRHSSWPVTGT